MTATNHALTGAIIGLSISNPIVAIPLAFASHFALDAIPHYRPLGSSHSDDEVIASKKFMPILSTDALLCLVLVAALFLSGTPNWLLAGLCAFAATSPDLAHITKVSAVVKGKPQPKPKDPLAKLHRKVQWFQEPVGIVVELVWAALAIWLIIFLAQR